MVKDYINGADIKRIRMKMGYTQKEFAKLICSSKPTVERWEREPDGVITGPVVALMRILENKPALASDYLEVRDTGHQKDVHGIALELAAHRSRQKAGKKQYDRQSVHQRQDHI